MSLSSADTRTDAHALAALTLDLCRIPSVSGNEASCADFVQSLLARTPYPPVRVGETVVACGPRRAGRPLVVLLGHTDTVPPKPGDAAPRQDGDTLVGLGSSDMKSGLAVMLHLAATLDPAALAYDLGFVFYDQEEGPWRLSGLGPTLEQVPWIAEAALGFCLEPSDNVVQVGCVGSLHVTVRFHGQAAHSARPWQGANAIHAAGALLTRLHARAPVDVWIDGFLFREVMSATLASGGVGRNVIPNAFELNLNYRFAPGKSLEQAQEDVRAVVYADGPDARVSLEFTDLSPSGRVVTQNPLLQAFLAANGNAITAKQAWTDVARLSQAGIDAVNLGPGISAQAHQAGEYASLALIVASYEQFARFLKGT